MATNKVGQIRESIWRDKDFRALSRGAQCTYLELISQSAIDRAGVQPLSVTKLAKGCDSITVDTIWADLNELQNRRFVFFDDDSEEVFVRSYMRTCEVWKVPNTLKSALRASTVVASDMIRHELAEELRKLHRADATATATEIDPGQQFAFVPPTPTEPIANPSATQADMNKGSGRVPQPTGTGMGMGTISSLVDGDFREGTRARADVTERNENPPSMFCQKHPRGTDANCRPCGAARAAHAEFMAKKVRTAQLAQSREAREQAELRKIAADQCDLCDETGYSGMVLCDHDPDSADRARRGVAMARAALTRASGE